MTLELISGYIHLWVTQYVAAFCLLSIVVWAVSSYLNARVWHRSARDLSLYFIAISVLAGILLVRPDRFVDSVLWTPVTWFCFTMLLMVEVIWITFLIEALLRTIKEAALRRDQALHTPATYKTYGTRR